MKSIFEQLSESVLSATESAMAGVVANHAQNLPNDNHMVVGMDRYRIIETLSRFFVKGDRVVVRCSQHGSKSPVVWSFIKVSKGGHDIKTVADWFCPPEWKTA